MTQRNDHGRWLLCVLLALSACSTTHIHEAVIATVQTPAAPAAIGPYSQAVASNGMVWASGQIGIDPATGQIVPGGIEAETRRVLQNLDAVLQAAQSDRTLVLRCTIYLADLADFAKVNALYAEYFGTHRPARATVQVAALPRAARIEIDAVANKRAVR